MKKSGAAVAGVVVVAAVDFNSRSEGKQREKGVVVVVVWWRSGVVGALRWVEGGGRLRAYSKAANIN